MTIVRTQKRRGPRETNLAVGVVRFRAPYTRLLAGSTLATFAESVPLVAGILPDTDLPQGPMQCQFQVDGEYLNDAWTTWRSFTVPATGPADLDALLGAATVWPAAVVGEAQAARDVAIERAAAAAMSAQQAQDVVTGAASVTSVAGKTGAVTLAPGDVQLGNANNTSDAQKPVSAAQAAADNLRQLLSEKNQPSGYAGIGADGFIPAGLLPSYVDDVIEYANLAAFPASNTAGRMYVAVDTGRIYRWSGSTYVEISASPGSTDAVPEGATNLYWTQGRSDARVAAGLAARTITAGTGLTGGGTLAADRSLAVVYGTAAGTAAQGNDPRLSDARTPASGTVAADVSMIVAGKGTTRATGSNDNPFGVLLQRAITITSITARALTADASGSTVLELRRNGTAVTGTTVTMAAASQVAGVTVTGSFTFAAGDVLSVNVVSLGTTPGLGLVVDMRALA